MARNATFHKTMKMNWCQWLLFLTILNVKFNCLCCNLVLRDGQLIFASVVSVSINKNFILLLNLAGSQIFSAGDHTPIVLFSSEPSDRQLGLGQLTNVSSIV